MAYFLIILFNLGIHLGGLKQEEVDKIVKSYELEDIRIENIGAN